MEEGSAGYQVRFSGMQGEVLRDGSVMGFRTLSENKREGS